jgi:hypothetical protein
LSIQAEDWHQALQFCTQAIYLEPSLPFSHMIVKYWLLPQPDLLDSLLELYSTISKLPKVHRLAHTLFGDLLTEKDRIAEAMTAYKNAWGRPHHPHRTRVTDQERTSIDYLVIGIGKAGTSALFSYLSQHPQIKNPITKEIHFFSQRFHCGFDWYMAQFPPLSSKAGHFITGETNPWYLSQVGVPERVFEALPNIKLITILRNPVSRAISHFYMAQKLGLEHRSLAAAMASEMAILENHIENPEKVAPTYWKTERGYLWCSLYLPFLKKWMSLFPQEQFLILSSEDLYHRPSQTLNHIFRFLGLDHFKLGDYPKINQGSYSLENGPLFQLLSDFFYDHNQQLEQYLDRTFQGMSAKVQLSKPR